MDVVYVVREGERNEQLRYSLRSLDNFAHDRVWMAGYKPSWVTGVEHIAVRQDGNRYQNSFRNLMTACLHDQVSDRFAYFNDDFYVMDRCRQIPRMHRGRLADMLGPARPNRKLRQNGYVTGLWDTFDLLCTLGYDDPLCYELHAPMTVDRRKMADALEVGREVPALMQRTIYGNLASHGGVETADQKVHTRKRPSPVGPFLSSSPTSFEGGVGDLLRERFPRPSRYEVD